MLTILFQHKELRIMVQLYIKQVYETDISEKLNVNVGHRRAVNTVKQCSVKIFPITSNVHNL